MLWFIFNFNPRFYFERREPATVFGEQVEREVAGGVEPDSETINSDQFNDEAGTKNAELAAAIPQTTDTTEPDANTAGPAELGTQADGGNSGGDQVVIYPSGSVLNAEGGLQRPLSNDLRTALIRRLLDMGFTQEKVTIILPFFEMGIPFPEKTICESILAELKAEQKVRAQLVEGFLSPKNGAYSLYLQEFFRINPKLRDFTGGVLTGDEGSDGVPSTQELEKFIQEIINSPQQTLALAEIERGLKNLLSKPETQSTEEKEVALDLPGDVEDSEQLAVDRLKAVVNHKEGLARVGEMLLRLVKRSKNYLLPVSMALGLAYIFYFSPTDGIFKSYNVAYAQEQIPPTVNPYKTPQLGDPGQKTPEPTPQKTPEPTPTQEEEEPPKPDLTPTTQPGDPGQKTPEPTSEQTPVPTPKPTFEVTVTPTSVTITATVPVPPTANTTPTYQPGDPEQRTPTAIATPTPTPTERVTVTVTMTPTQTPTETPEQPQTATATPTATETPTITATATIQFPDGTVTTIPVQIPTLRPTAQATVKPANTFGFVEGNKGDSFIDPQALAVAVVGVVVIAIIGAGLVSGRRGR